MTGEIEWFVYPESRDLSLKLSHRIGKHPLLGQLLLNRNLRSVSEVTHFLTPHPVADISGEMERQFQAAIDRIDAHIKAGSKMLVYGDYDVDGMTSTSMMVEFLRGKSRYPTDILYYIPERFKEGYGLSPMTLQTIEECRPKLVITLDCGVTNVSEVQWLRDKGMEVVIFDHHTMPDSLPPAQAILTPKWVDERHPLAHLCTAGLVYTWIEYYTQVKAEEEDVRRYLDLAAVGTIADIVPVIGQNRWMVREGLKEVAKRQRPGLSLLLEMAGINGPVSDRDIAFGIAPRLNAPGRLSDPKISVELLTSATKERAFPWAEQIQKLNEHRRKIGQWILENAEEKIAADPSIADHHILILHAADWHPGVIGIIASQLSNKYARPTVLISGEGDGCRGSVRSIEGVNVYQILKQASDFFLKFGGHAQAAGFSMAEDRIPGFKHACEKVALQDIKREVLVPKLTIDCKVSPAELNRTFIEEIESLAPFGCGNPKPVFYTNQLTAVDFRTVGNGTHLKATFADADRQCVIDGIGFGIAEKMSLLYKDQVELAFCLELNEWNGQTKPQLQLVDIK